MRHHAPWVERNDYEQLERNFVHKPQKFRPEFFKVRELKARHPKLERSLKTFDFRKG